LSRKKSIPFTPISTGVDTLVRTVRENITGIRVIKALSKTDYEKQRFPASTKTSSTRKKKRA
jgi:ATP-binding cassette subfamily B protein